jgi:hypothetical protein
LNQEIRNPLVPEVFESGGQEPSPPFKQIFGFLVSRLNLLRSLGGKSSTCFESLAVASHPLQPEMTANALMLKVLDQIYKVSPLSPSSSPKN